MFCSWWKNYILQLRRERERKPNKTEEKYLTEVKNRSFNSGKPCGTATHFRQKRIHAQYARNKFYEAMVTKGHSRPNRKWPHVGRTPAMVAPATPESRASGATHRAKKILHSIKCGLLQTTLGLMERPLVTINTLDKTSESADLIRLCRCCFKLLVRPDLHSIQQGVIHSFH